MGTSRPFCALSERLGDLYAYLHSDNAAGNTGWAEFVVQINKTVRVISLPGSAGSNVAESFSLNLHLVDGLDPAQPSTIRYYRGERTSTEDDPALVQVMPPAPPAYEGSWRTFQRAYRRWLRDAMKYWTKPRFTGTINGLPVTVTFKNLSAVTPETDEVRARIEYTIAGRTEVQTLTFTETGAETNIMRLEVSDNNESRQTVNAFIPADLLPDRADVLQYYLGKRQPLPDDSILTETGEDSFVFEGAFDDATARVNISLASPDALTTPTNPDFDPSTSLVTPGEIDPQTGLAHVVPEAGQSVIFSDGAREDIGISAHYIVDGAPDPIPVAPRAISFIRNLLILREAKGQCRIYSTQVSSASNVVDLDEYYDTVAVLRQLEMGI